MLDLQSLSDGDLILKTKESVEVETAATTNVVRHFCEISRRDLYLARGYSSMFLFAVSECGYDKASAQRRVNAMTLALNVPETLEKIDLGQMCLQAASDIQTYLNFERGRRNAYSVDQMKELVKSCTGLSTRKVQIELASRNPQIDFSSSKKPISEDYFRVTNTISTSTDAKIERIKNLRSHVNPYMSWDDVLDFMAEMTLNQIDPQRKAERAEIRQAQKATERAKGKTAQTTRHQQSPQTDAKLDEELLAQTEVSAAKESSAQADVATSEEPIKQTEVPAPEPIVVPVPLRDEIVSDAGEVQLAVDFAQLNRMDQLNPELGQVDQPISLPRPITPTRYIKAEDQRAVRQNHDNLGCVFVDPVTGRRCGSRHQEQFDHIHEFSRGGSNDPDNLRIYCAKHNRFRWRGRTVSHMNTERRSYR